MVAAGLPMRQTHGRMDSVEAKRRTRKGRTFAVLLLLVVAGALLGFASDRARHHGRVWRGVRAGAVELSNLDADSARRALSAHADLRAQETIAVHIGDTTERVTLGDLGFRLDVDATVQRAMAARREPGLRQLRSWLAGFRSPIDVGLVANVNEEKLDPLLERWERERVAGPFEGAVIVKDGEAAGEPPRTGHAVPRDEARRSAAELVVTGDTDWVLPLAERAPRRAPTSVEGALVRAKELLAEPIALYVERFELDPATDGAAHPGAASSAHRKVPAPDPGERITVTFSRQQLLSALKSRLVEEPLGLEVYFDPAALDPMLGDLRKVVELPSVEPHFEIDPRERPFVVQGSTGRIIKADAVAKALELAAATSDRMGKLPVDLGPKPGTTVAELEVLGITKLVARFTTQHPCCMPRVDNIHRIADLIDGVLVKPGETFSVNEHVGERTVEKGFKAAPTIVYGEMEDTIGGGISQFATTLFNAAFYGGYDIVERKPHSFYIPRYPMGHEATLSYPKPDLVIRNDSKAGLLIRCLYDKTSITVKLYGDNGGLHVRRKVSQVRDVVQPPVEYIPDPALEPDEEKNKERGQVGWTVTVSRIIEFPDGTSRTDERKVTYQPRVRRVRVHPCKVPEGHKGHTGEKCPEPEGSPEDEAHDHLDAPADVPKEGEVPKDRPLEDEG
jgi:vancomycin resistance protein YoaR